MFYMRLASLFGLFVAATLAVSPAFAQDLDSREGFAKAYALYAQGNLSEAKELFSKARDAKFPLADYSLYYLALIASNESQWDESRRLLAQLKRRYPQSIWYFPAGLQLAKIDIAEKNYSQATETLQALRSATGVKKEIVEEAAYLLAQAQEAQENYALANALYQELRDRFPSSRWDGAARKDQARLRNKFPEIFGFSTLQSLAEEADRLAREREFGEAEILYKKLINNTPEREPRLTYLAKLASLYVARRQREEAVPLLNLIAREYPETAEAPKALYQIGQFLWNRHENRQALEYFRIILEQYPTSAYVDRATYAAGDIYESFGQKNQAIELYNRIIVQLPNSPVREDAMWRLAWAYYRAAEWPAAFSAFGALATQAKDRGLAIAAIYWQARTGEKTGDEAAKQLYLQIVKGGGESYYQGLATRALERLGISPVEAKKPPSAPAAEPDPPLTAKLFFHLSRARELAAISLNRMAVAELDEIGRENPPGRVRPLLMREYFRNQAYSRSLALANQLPTSDGERNLYRYPLAFWTMVKQHAEQRGVDPYLVLALIRQESLFDTRARSSATALGLMQLLPSTAKRIAKQVGISSPSPEALFEPEVNLALGTQYLKDLLQRYSNNWFKAIAAYNAGESAVDRWEKEIDTDDIEEFVERIPYGETRGYVKLVMRNHRIYKKLYDSAK
jgi:soluble lytic murein transglycosylase